MSFMYCKVIEMSLGLTTDIEVEFGLVALVSILMTTTLVSALGLMGFKVIIQIMWE